MLALSASWALRASALASAGSSSKSRSPALTVWPLSTWIAATLPGIERFDHLGIAGGLDLARRRRMDVEPAEIRPDQRREREGADRRHQRDRQRRGRRFEDFERGRQEFAVAPRDRGRNGPRRPGLSRGGPLGGAARSFMPAPSHGRIAAPTGGRRGRPRARAALRARQPRRSRPSACPRSGSRGEPPPGDGR